MADQDILDSVNAHRPACLHTLNASVKEIIRAGKSIVFLQGRLYNERGELTATASSTAKVILPKTS